MNSQTVTRWINEYGNFGAAKVLYEGNMISLQEYLVTRGINPDIETISDLQEDYKHFGLDKLKFERPSHTKKWFLFFQGEEEATEEEATEEEATEEEATEEEPCFKREINLIIRFPQSGKTRLIMSEMETFHKKYEDTSIISIGIVVGGNNLLLNNQTARRADEHPMVKPLIISSKPQCRGENYSSAMKPEVLKYLVSRERNTLFVCGNSRRIHEGGDISDFLENISRYNKSYRLHIVVDEVDKVFSEKIFKTSVHKWLHQKSDTGHLLVEQMNLVTATPFNITPTWKILKNWVGKDLPEGKIIIQHIDKLFGENYHLLSTSKYINHEGWEEALHDDEQSEVSKYIGSYFHKICPENGEVWLIPGNRQAQSHAEIAELCKADNPNTGEPYFTDILVINSKSKEIQYDEGYSYEIGFQEYHKTMWGRVSCKSLGADKMEIQQWLKEYWSGKDSNRRLAITGNLCLGRGITFSSEVCNISVGLFGPYCTKDIVEKYQLYNRLAGYTRSVGDKPVLVCTQEDYTSVVKYEFALQQFMKLGQDPSEKVRTLDDEKVGDIIEQANRQYDTYDENMWIHEWQVFDDKSLAEKWLGRRMREFTVDPDKPEFYQSSYTSTKKILSYEEVCNAMKSIDSGKAKKTMNLPQNNETASRTYLVYKNLNDPDSLYYICRKLKRIR